MVFRTDARPRSLCGLVWKAACAFAQPPALECFPPSGALTTEYCCADGGLADCFTEEYTFRRCCPGFVGQDPVTCFEGDAPLENFCCSGDGDETCFDDVFTRRACCKATWNGESRNPFHDRVQIAHRAAEAAGPLTAGSLFAHLVHLQGSLSRCVEIGVQRGDFSSHFLGALHSFGVVMPRYFMVDIWREQSHYNDKANVRDDAQVANLCTASASVADFWQSVSLLQLPSREAAPLFEKESLDFVYLDARHDYCAVAEELELYWPLLKPGGVLGGDDFRSKRLTSSWETWRWDVCENGSHIEGGVNRAVTDFVHERSLEDFFQALNDQFIMQKPVF